MAWRRASKSLLGFPFFGLSPEYRLSAFNQIHEICFYGQGGYTWETVYEMPLWLRRYTYNNVAKSTKEMHEAMYGKKKGDNQTVIDPTKPLNAEQRTKVPAYTVRGPKRD